MVTNIFLAIGFTLTSFFCTWLVRRNRLYKEFQETMVIHDLCIFYKGEEKHIGNIVAIFEHNVIVEDQEGNAVPLQKSEIYPVLPF
ncbi:hypothetical protein [Massilibacteroides sp.]|uniref:hypothetical protein n=1 Tax=Massilibacteroides sp. TaxID=2034766 RepID=UPI0026263CA9|nr:hypothetical protein [Massilibacteroides sp.]MDD4515422.1 hypothetical protein [Massilibacteroides sp.]